MSCNEQIAFQASCSVAACVEGYAFAQFTLNLSNQSSTSDTAFSPDSAIPGTMIDTDTNGWTIAPAVEPDGQIVMCAGSTDPAQYTGGNAFLSYDHDGNTTTNAKGNTYTYDAWNHLTGVKDATGASIASYTVNALGQRITQAYPTTVSNLHYNQQGQIIEVQNSSGTTTQQTVYSPFYVNDVVLRDDSSTSGGYGKSSSGLGTRYWAEHDANHDQVALLISSSSVQARWVYDAYGKPTLTAGTAPSIFWASGFQGGWTDPVTGLVHFNARDMNTGTGTWMTADPAGYVDGRDVNQVELSNPTSNLDPSGNAVYFVEREFGSNTQLNAYEWAKGYGHGYLLITDCTDTGKADPIMSMKKIVATFSFHPYTFTQMTSVVAGRVCEDAPEDESPASKGLAYKTFLVTTSKRDQERLVNNVQAWIAGRGAGYESGPGKPDPTTPGNSIGSGKHMLPTGSAGYDGGAREYVYYDLYSHNCVWWCAAMLSQSGLPIPAAIKVYNGGHGSASDVQPGSGAALSGGANTNPW